MLGWEYPPFNSGGLGIACQGLATALAKQGTEIIFVLPRRFPVASKYFRFRFASVGTPLKSGYTTWRGKSDPNYTGELFRQVRQYAQTITNILETEDFDLIHAHDWLTYPAGIRAKEFSGKKLVTHVHATEFDRGGGHVNQMIYEEEKNGLQKADQVMAVSNYTRQLVIKHYGVPEGKVRVLHNGINPEEFITTQTFSTGLNSLKKAGYKIVLFAGRLTLQKGPEYFLYAAKEVLRDSPKTIFVMAGDGEMLGQMMNLTASLKMSNNVIFPGFLRGKELSDAFAQSDLLVMPSVSEPFGIVPLEAMAYGTPVIVSKQSGVSEVVSHVFKVDFWDIDEMAEQILSILKYKALKETMSLNGKRQSLSCSWDKTARQCLSYYQSL